MIVWFERCIQVHIMHRWNIIYFALVLNWKQQFWENLKTEFFSSFSSQKNFKKLFSSKLLLSLLLCLITVRVVWWGRLDNVISSKISSPFCKVFLSFLPYLERSSWFQRDSLMCVIVGVPEQVKILLGYNHDHYHAWIYLCIRLIWLYIYICMIYNNDNYEKIPLKDSQIVMIRQF